MSKPMQPFSDLIERRLLELNSNAFAVEQAAGLPADAIRNVIRSTKKDGPTISRAKEICDALGLDFYIGPKRFPGGFAEGGEASDLARKDPSRSNFFPIPWHPEAKLKGCAPVGLSQPWLAAEGLIPDFLNAVVPDQSSVLIAPAKNTVAVIQTNALKKGNGGLWCYKDGSMIGIANTVFADGLTILLPSSDSDDARIISQDTPYAFRLLGKVVWLGILT